MRVQKMFLGLSFALALSLSGIASGNSYNKGFVAAEAGNYQTALKHWGPLAEQGNAIAQFNLAMLYHSGLGVEMDESKALQWYMKSAENGYSKAQEYLVAGYTEGWFGLPKDSKKAAYWQNRLDSGK